MTDRAIADDRPPLEPGCVADPESYAKWHAAQEASKMPARYRNALVHVIDDAMPETFVTATGRWLYENRARLVRGGDEQGVARFNYELVDADQACDLGQLKSRIVDAIPEAIATNGIPDFDLAYIECHATLYHHGGHFCWHTDAPGYDGEFVPSRRLAWCFYMHTQPKMFSGGELEFLDGTKVCPSNNRLVLFHPLQQHQIRKVECWSAHVLHGRWAMFGWVHGPAPDGYRAPEIHGAPKSG